MKKSNVQITAAAVFAAMLLGGCGDEPYALSEKEEQIIVNYSAHVVGKFNKTGKEGLRLIDVEALLEEEAAAQEPEAGGDTELSSESPEGTPAAGDGCAGESGADRQSGRALWLGEYKGGLCGVKTFHGLCGERILCDGCGCGHGISGCRD